MSISQVSIGAYIWEAISSVGFEWSLITRKRAFKWPMLVRLHLPSSAYHINSNRFPDLFLLQMDACGCFLRHVSPWAKTPWRVVLIHSSG
jgi:hypothetical protein